MNTAQAEIQIGDEVKVVREGLNFGDTAKVVDIRPDWQPWRYVVSFPGEDFPPGGGWMYWASDLERVA